MHTVLVHVCVQVIQNNQSLEDCPSISDIYSGNAGDVEVNVGFIRQCYINQIFEEVQMYDVYRYDGSCTCNYVYACNLCVHVAL